jgi:hypothetical protein
LGELFSLAGCSASQESRAPKSEFLGALSRVPKELDDPFAAEGRAAMGSMGSVGAESCMHRKPSVVG